MRGSVSSGTSGVEGREAVIKGKKGGGGMGLAGGEQEQRKFTMTIWSHHLEEKCIKGKLRQGLKGRIILSVKEN